MKKVSILIVGIVLLVGCASQYEMSDDRCRDSKTGKFVKTEMCK